MERRGSPRRVTIAAWVSSTTNRNCGPRTPAAMAAITIRAAISFITAYSWLGSGTTPPSPDTSTILMLGSTMNLVTPGRMSSMASR